MNGYIDMTKRWEKARQRAVWWPEEVRAFHREQLEESPFSLYQPACRLWRGIAIAIPLGLIIWALLMLGVAVVGAAFGLWSHPGEWFR